MVDIKRDVGKRRPAFVRFGAPAVLLTVAALGFCHFKPSSPRVPAGSLHIGVVRAGAMVVEVRAAGTLVAEETRWIPAATDGRVDRILVRPGDTVGPDTVLVELTNAEVARAAGDALLEVQAAEAEMRKLHLTLERQALSQEAVVASARAEHAEARNRARADAELAQVGLTSALTLQAAQGREQQLRVRADVEQKGLELLHRSERTELEAAESRLDRLRSTAALRGQQMEALAVRAGRGGVVQQIAVEVGARVSEGTNLARVAAREPLEAVLQISQLEASQIAAGQQVLVDTHQGIVTGTVSRIDPAVQNGSVTVDVRLPSQLPRGARPDLSIDAAIEIDRIDNALHTGRPVQARAQTSIVMFRLSSDGRTATRVPVRIGRTSLNAVEIVSGLRAGDRVILSDTSTFDRYEQITLTD
ncbi:MAG TPA: HlyD family efflux transporter periplasmic adaptor subunit [Thermoanaerobaculia bacterium]|nr:HlyD family efflux transporter periplasmic adaptor subunit [Thermoanaerobaculia bacterium]